MAKTAEKTKDVVSPAQRLHEANAARKAAGLPIGRPKGSVNRLTALLRNAVGETFESMGGIEGMLKWAEKNPDVFYSLCMKMIPKELEANAKGSGITVVVQGRAQLRDRASGAVIDAESGEVIEGDE